MTQFNTLPHMRTAALDLGDRWTGIAISDPLGLIARPLTTIQTRDLSPFITNLITTHQITTIVVGYPQTLRSTESEQTKKVLEMVDSLRTHFPQITWILWDERLTSKQVSSWYREKTAADKQKSHARVAALILTGYLEHKTPLNN